MLDSKQKQRHIRGPIFKTEKAINHIFKRDLDFLKKAIHLIIFLRLYGNPFKYNKLQNHEKSAIMGLDFKK